MKRKYIFIFFVVLGYNGGSGGVGGGYHRTAVLVCYIACHFWVLKIVKGGFGIKVWRSLRKRVAGYDGACCNRLRVLKPYSPCVCLPIPESILPCRSFLRLMKQ